MNGMCRQYVGPLVGEGRKRQQMKRTVWDQDQVRSLSVLLDRQQQLVEESLSERQVRFPGVEFLSYIDPRRTQAASLMAIGMA